MAYVGRGAGCLASKIPVAENIENMYEAKKPFGELVRLTRKKV